MKHDAFAASPALGYARQALSLMAEQRIEPTPVNYMVWYHYVAREHPGLTQELGDLLGRKNSAVSPEVITYLFHKYLDDSKNAEASIVAESSQATQAVLTGVLGMMERFSDDTQHYTSEMDEQIRRLAVPTGTPLHQTAQELKQRAEAMRDSSSHITDTLNDSKREVAQLRKELEKVTTEMNRDFLTGTGNRKALEAKLEELTIWASEQQANLCLLMLDIDHFKKVNDTYGHLIGDEVLKNVGRTLFDSVRGKDFVARYGGEEFAVLLPNTELAGGLIVAEHIRRTVSEMTLRRKDTGTPLAPISISIGVARYRPGADSIAQWLSRADKALYQSKTGGRNRVTPESF